MVPIAHLSPRVIALVIGTSLGALLLGTMRGVLAAEGARRSGLWPLVALASSGAFLVRVALVRPHVLAITLALWLTWAAARGRARHAALAGLLFPLCYVGWIQALFLVGIAAVASVLAGRRPPWKTYGAVVAGLVVGVLVHPNFPNNVRFAWLTTADILVGHAWGAQLDFDMGGEFRPLSAASLVRIVGVPIALALGAGFFAWKKRREDLVLLTFALAALAYLAVTLRTQRFVEYFVPFAVTAAGLAARWAPPRVGAPTVLALSALYTGLLGLGPVRALGTRSELFPAAVQASLRRAIPPGARVCTCDWQFTGEMMLALPEREFLVALDPVLFWKKDPAAYQAWFAMTHGRPGDPVRVIRDVLGARFVLCDTRRQWVPFLRSLAARPDARYRGRAGYWEVFEVAPAGAPLPAP